MPALPATLTIRQARAAVRALEAELGDNGSAVTIDASALETFDTAAIAVLLELRRQAQASGRAFSVAGAPTALIEIASLSGVAELLGFPASAAVHSARA